MFGKKCPRCGRKLSKQKVWHATSGTFEVEMNCIFCLSPEEVQNNIKKNQDNTVTIPFKTPEQLEKEQRDRQSERESENKIYEDFVKKEKERIDEEKKLKDSVPLLIEQGNLLYTNGNYEESIVCYDKVLEIEPKNIDALISKGNFLVKEGKDVESLEYFNKILEIDQNNIDALISKGVLFSKLGKYPGAIRFFDRILEIEPNNDIALAGKEELLLKLSSYEEPSKIAKFVTTATIPIRFFTEREIEEKTFTRKLDDDKFSPIRQGIRRRKIIGNILTVSIRTKEHEAHFSKLISGGNFDFWSHDVGGYIMTVGFETPDQDLMENIARLLRTVRQFHILPGNLTLSCFINQMSPTYREAEDILKRSCEAIKENLQSISEINIAYHLSTMDEQVTDARSSNSEKFERDSWTCAVCQQKFSDHGHYLNHGCHFR